MLVSAGTRGDVNGDGKLKLAIYASDDPYGHGFSDALKKDVMHFSSQAVVEQLFHDVKAVPTEYDWAADVAKLTDKHNVTTGKTDGVPDAVVVISFPKFEVQFTQAYLESKSRVRLLHTHNFRAVRVLEALSTAVEGPEGTSQAVLGDGKPPRGVRDDLQAPPRQPPALRAAAAD